MNSCKKYVFYEKIILGVNETMDGQTLEQEYEQACLMKRI